MFLFTLILTHLSLFLLRTLAINGLSTTVSIWLPWLPNSIHHPLLASAINAGPNLTTYALSCPAITNLPNNIIPACIINGPLPQTVTAGPRNVIMSRSADGNLEQWGCKLTGTTTGTCEVHSTWSQRTMAGQTQGPGREVNVSAYAAESIVSRGVTVTAGSLTLNATATTSMSGVSTSTGATTTATAPPTKNAAIAVRIGHGPWLAVGVGVVGLVIGTA